MPHSRFRIRTIMIAIEGGTYEPVDTSEFLPVRSDEVGRCVLEEDRRAGSRWARRLRSWVRAELGGGSRPSTRRLRDAIMNGYQSSGRWRPI
jgi:hypothetical protein